MRATVKLTATEIREALVTLLDSHGYTLVGSTQGLPDEIVVEVELKKPTKPPTVYRGPAVNRSSANNPKEPEEFESNEYGPNHR